MRNNDMTRMKRGRDKYIRRAGFWANKLAIIRKSEFVIPLTILFGIFLLLFVSAYENNSDNSSISSIQENHATDVILGAGDFPQINFVSPTPLINSNRNANWFEVNVTISGVNSLKNLSYTLNGTTTSLYDDSLVFMMNFDNLTSIGENATRVVDASKYGNNGTINGGVVWNSSGKFGRSMTFDGVNGYIDAGNPVSLQINGSITVSVWVNPSGSQVAYSNILRKEFSSNKGFALEQNNTNINQYYFYFANGTSYQGTGVMSSLTANNWQLFTIVLGNNNITHYVNGIQTAYSLVNISMVADTSNIFAIGRWSSNSARYFNGSIDEVRIWNRSLSATEVNQLYMSNLQKYNSTQWNLYVNQTLNSTTGLGNGIYSYGVSALDTLGNSNSSVTRILGLNNPAPNLSWISPSPSAGGLNNASISLNVSVSSNVESYALFGDGLVGWWRFENSSNATDETGINNGTLYGGVTNSTGRFGQGYSFDGSSGYINAGNGGFLNPNSSITLSAWVNMKTFIGNYPSIFNKWDFEGSYDKSYELDLRDGGITFYLRKGDNSGEIGQNTNVSLSINTWYHIVATLDNQNINIYLNGVLRNTTSYNFGLRASNTNLQIGRQAGLYVNGSIDEVAIWNRSLSADEVKALYNSSAYKLQRTLTSTSGAKSYTAYAVDVLGSKNSSSLTFNVDADAPIINYTSPTPANNSYTNMSSFIVNVSIVEPNLRNLSYTLNGTTTSLYDDSLVLMMNFDNLSSIGENATRVVDVSKYCYDNETEILGENGWKLFNELGNEKVATLNQKTGELEWQMPMEKQVFDEDKAMYQIELDDGSEMKVSEKHRVYSKSIPNDFSLSTNSFVSNDSTNDCFLKCASLDQIGISLAKANAKYNVSSLSGIDEFARSIKDLNSVSGMKEILLLISLNSSSIASSDKALNFNILGLCSSSSLSNCIGENNFIPFKNNIFLVTPNPVNAVNTIPESITSSIYFNEGCNFFNLSCMDALTDLANSTASFSVNFDFETSSWNLSYPSVSSTRLANASLATSDQLITLNESIFFFNSSGRNIVKFGMLNSSVFSTQNTQSIQVYKSFDLMPIIDVYASIESSLNKSFVDSIFTDFCCVNALSSDQMGILSERARAKYVLSLSCGDNLDASGKNLTYSCLDDNSNCLVSNLQRYVNSSSLIQANRLIFSLSESNSSKAKSVEQNLTSLFTNSLITCLLTESALKNENRIFASGINNLGRDSMADYAVCLLATRSFKSEDNFSICSSVNFDLDNIESAIENSMSTTSFFNALAKAKVNNSLYSLGTSTLTTTSSIGNLSHNRYLNVLKDFSLRNVSEVYEEVNSGEEVYFLNAENEPVRVKSIEKVPYVGKIYDVDVPNDIVLVRRHNGSAIWSGNSNNGTVNGGASWNSSGRYGGAMTFDGVNDWINVTNNISTGNGSLSAGFWFKTTKNQPSGQIPLTTRINSSDINVAYYIEFDSNLISLYADSNEPVSYAINYADGLWHYVFATKEIIGVTSYRKLYYDSVLVSNDTKVPNPVGGFLINYITIGGYHGSSYPFNGSIDEVRIWNRSLSALEVNQLYMSNLQKYNSTQWNLYVNQTLNSTAGLGNGAYSYSVNAVDMVNNLNSSEVRRITLDSASPTGNLLAPLNNSYVNNGTQNFTLNFSDNFGVANATFNIADPNVNYWLDFDGVNDFVNVSNNSSLSITTQISISAWVNLASSAGTYQGILGKWGSSASSQSYLFYKAGVGESNKWQFILEDSSGNVFGLARGNTSVANTWVHLVGIWNGSIISIYENGILTGSANATGTIRTSTQNVTIGTYDTAYFNGSIDEVRIYNRTLNSSEISTLYSRGRTSNVSAVNSSGLVAYYDFNENAGSVLTDRSGNGNNGTISGATWRSSASATVSFGSGVVTGTVGVVVTLIDGIYKWWWSLFDWAGNSFVTANGTVIVDTTAPAINIVSPTLANNTFVNATAVVANYTITDLNLKNLTWTFNGTSYAYGSNYSLLTPANFTNGLVLLMNFDNETTYGENATRIYDFSGQGNNGTTYSSSSSKLNGGLFGTSPAYAVGTEFDKAFDGNVNTYFDYYTPSGAYTGMDLGSGNESSVVKIRYYPRSGQAGRMPGGIFQGSNDNITYTNIYTISSTPTDNAWTEVGGLSTAPYRYLRYLSSGGSYGNVAEIEFYTSKRTLYASGKYGSAVTFDGANDYVNISNSASLNMSGKNLAISAWIKTNTSSINYARIVDKASNYQMYLYDTTGNFGGYIYGACSQDENSNKFVADNQWHHLVMTYNYTYLSFYVDGNNYTGATCSGSSASTTSPLIIAGAGVSYFNGSIDELAIWNRSLSANEISQLYQSQLKKYTETNTTYFNYIPNANTSAKITSADGVNWNFVLNQSNVLNGAYNYLFSVADMAGNVNTTETRKITLDSVSPNATVLNYTNGAYLNNGTLNFSLNVSDAIGAKNATFYLYNSTGLVNQTTVTFAEGAVSTVIGTVKVLIDGVYTWFWSLFDWAGNSFVTANGTVIVDTTAPVVNFTSPTPSDGDGANGAFFANATISDLYLSNITWSWNNVNYTFGSNYSIVPPANFSNGLVLMMNFDNETSYGENATRVVDFSGMGNNGTVNGGAVWNASGKYGGAMSFDGGSGYVESSFSVPNGAISMCAWIKTNTYTSGIFGFANGRGSATNDRELYLDSSGRLKFQVYRGASYYATGTTVLLNGTWYYVCGTIDTTNGNSVWVNGINENSNSGGTNGYNSYTTPKFEISNGVSALGTNNFNGLIDEIMVWNRSLSVGEIQQLYNSQVRKYGNDIYYNTNLSASSTMQVRGVDGVNWNVLVNQTGLGIGQTYNYSLFGSDLAGNIGSSGMRRVMGNTIPILRSILLTPNDTDSVDPSGVLSVRVNITDSTDNFESAKFQWKNSTASEWNNISLVNVSGSLSAMILNASWALPSYESNLTYRVWMKDVVETTNSSSYTIGSFWDCSWNVSTTSLQSAGGFFTEKELGNVTIINTGDVQYANNNCSILFARTASGSSWAQVVGLNFSANYFLPTNSFPNGESGLRYYKNGSAVGSVRINVSSNETISIHGIFPSASSVFEENPAIVIASNINDTVRGRNNVTITSKMVITPGAYLERGIENIPSFVYLTPGNTTINTYVRDLVDGADSVNNIAYNVSLNWTIPSELRGLLSADSNISLLEVVVNDTVKRYLNITLDLTSSNLASLGPSNYTLYSYAQGYENSTGNLSLIIHSGNNSVLSGSFVLNFMCYSMSDGVSVSACGAADGDYVPSTLTETTITNAGGGGGGGGGAGGAGGSGSRFITESSRFELTRGKQNSFTVEFKNPFVVGEIKDLQISLTGLLSEYITVSPSSLDSLAAGETLKITSEITAPKYFNEGKYNLTMIITGTQTANQSTSEVNERKVITLYIFDISSAEGLKYIDNSDKYLLDMKSKNWSVREVEGLLNDIRTAYNSTSLDIVNAKYNQLKSLYDKAVQSDLLIKALREEMDNSKLDGISTPETNKLVNLAESAFLRGDYNLAMDRLKEAQLSFALETKGEFSLVYYVKRHPTNTAGIVLATLVFVTGTSLLVRKRLLKSKLKLLGEEETLLLGLMKVVQKQCFEEAKMSMEEYETTMAQYESRLNTVIQEKIETESKLLNLMRIRGGRKKALKEESLRLKDLIRETQKMYFEQNKIETRVYNNMMKSYAAKLSEIEEKLATLEAREALSKAGFRGGIKI